MKGHINCSVHGAKALRGVAHPSFFKNGTKSRVIPGRLLPHIRSAAEAEDLTDLEEDIGIADARMAELMAGMDNEATAQMWSRLKTMCREAEDFNKVQQFSKYVDKVTEIFALIARGADDNTTWNRYLAVGEIKRKLIETQGRTRRDAENNIAVDDMVAEVVKLAALIKARLPAGQLRTDLLVDIQREILGNPIRRN